MENTIIRNKKLKLLWKRYHYFLTKQSIFYLFIIMMMLMNYEVFDYE